MPVPRPIGDRTPAQRQADHASLGRLSESLVPALVQKLASSGLGELEVREGDWRIRLRRAASTAAPAPRRTERPRLGAHGDRDGRARDGAGASGAGALAATSSGAAGGAAAASERTASITRLRSPDGGWSRSTVSGRTSAAGRRRSSSRRHSSQPARCPSRSAVSVGSSAPSR